MSRQISEGQTAFEFFLVWFCLAFLVIFIVAVWRNVRLPHLRRCTNSRVEEEVSRREAERQRREKEVRSGEQRRELAEMSDFDDENEESLQSRIAMYEENAVRTFFQA